MATTAHIVIHKTVHHKDGKYINNYSSSIILYPSCPNSLSEMTHAFANKLLIHQIYNKGSMLSYKRYPQVEISLSRDSTPQNTCPNLIRQCQIDLNAIYR